MDFLASANEMVGSSKTSAVMRPPYHLNSGSQILSPLLARTKALREVVSPQGLRHGKYQINRECLMVLKE